VADLASDSDKSVLALTDAKGLFGIYLLKGQLLVLDVLKGPLFLQIIILGLIHLEFTTDSLRYRFNALWNVFETFE